VTLSAGPRWGHCASSSHCLRIASPWPTTDRHGLSVANFSYSLCDNDKTLWRLRRRSWRTCIMPPALRKPSPSSAKPTSSALPHGGGRAGRRG
jgi:hypothetical protein